MLKLTGDARVESFPALENRWPNRVCRIFRTGYNGSSLYLPAVKIAAAVLLLGQSVRHII